VVPAIQLMMRVERDAELQRRPDREDRGNQASYELFRPTAHLRRITHAVSRFAVGTHTLKMQNQGALQCNCAC
jgi:hypothetical protein